MLSLVGQLELNLRHNRTLDVAPHAAYPPLVLPREGDVDGFAAVGFLEVEGEGGARGHDVVVEGVVGFGGRVEEVVDDDGAVVACGFGAVVCAAYPEADKESR